VRHHKIASLLAASLLMGACSPGPTSEEQGTARSRTALAATSPAQPTPDPTQTPIDFEPAPLEEFSKKKAMAHVRKLADDIGIRVRATEGERLGARYIADRFRAFGYDVKIQKFKVDGGKTSRNVVATWPGAKRYPFIVGGHMDSVPGSPGANDNASGVAVVLELARIFAGRDQSAWTHFVAFGSEEKGTDGTNHAGSRVLVNRLGQTGRARLGGMVSVDMVADGRPLLVGNTGFSSDIVARTLYNRIRRANINVEFYKLCDCSDHGPFERAGIPASFAYSGQEPDYHSPTDTTPNMKPDDLARTGRAMRVFVRALDRKMIQKFRDGR
jgi:hypothetical protein